jgi:hypothetical protein
MTYRAHRDPRSPPLVSDALSLDLALFSSRRQALLPLAPLGLVLERLEPRQRLPVPDVHLDNLLGPIRRRRLDERSEPIELQSFGQTLDSEGRPARLGVEDDDLAETARLERRRVDVHLQRSWKVRLLWGRRARVWKTNLDQNLEEGSLDVE